jgi:hypothetical protein
VRFARLRFIAPDVVLSLLLLCGLGACKADFARKVDALADRACACRDVPCLDPIFDDQARLLAQEMARLGEREFDALVDRADSREAIARFTGCVLQAAKRGMPAR